MPKMTTLCAAWLAVAPALSIAAQGQHIQYDPAAQIWTLRSGRVEYRLRRSGDGVAFDYFGPEGKPRWPAPGREISGLVEGQDIGPDDLRLVTVEPTVTERELALLYRHRRLPLEIQAVYRAQGDTGVITRRLTLTNRGERVLHVASLPSLAWSLPAADYDLTYLWGGWGQERQLSTEPLSIGRRGFTADRGRSTNGYTPWFALRDRDRGVLYMAQLAWSGNWQMSFGRDPGGDRTRPNQFALSTELGMRFDFGGALALPPGGSFALPEVAFTATAGDLDDAANQLHRYQRSAIPRRPAGDPLLVQFNSWYPFSENVSAGELERAADLAAQLGIEAFVLDSGWYNKKDWSLELGDYQTNPAKFPNGLHELARYVRGKGMKFGLWVEIENAGIGSQLARAHPDWFLAYNGAPILKDQRQQLNFARPEVRQWARATVDRLIHEYDLGWIKIDYNIDIGERFDPPGDGGAGDVLYRHVKAYYGWLDDLRAAHPDLLVENCSSGGLRFDLGILAHAHTTWLSDVVSPLASAQLAYGCTVEFAPEVCNHWMVGDDDRGRVDPAKPAGWWDFLFRVPMNGQFGVSSRILDWSPELRQRAAANIAMYKRLRQIIDGADVYHPTAQPAHDDPQGWMAIEYVAQDAGRSVVLAYRLGHSDAQRSFRLRGLTAARYRASQDGRPVGSYTAQELSDRGLPVRLDAEWRAAVVELTAER
jgi:alpha-galactosidase